MARGEVPGRAHGTAVSRISTASARRASTSTRSSVISRPWDSSGTRGRTSSMIATRPMPRHSGALKPGGFCTRASARGPTFTPPRRPTGARSSSMPAPAAICRTRRWRRAGQRDARRAGELPWTAARSPSKTSFREPTRKSSTATAATSSYAAPTARSPISWQWWWHDAAQGVNSVVRGVDLLCSTPQQRYLQDLLGLPHPAYAHVPLLVAEQNRRLSKRDRDAALDELLARFGSPRAVIGHIAAVAGLVPEEAPTTPEELLKDFSLEGFRDGLPDLVQIPWRS